MYQLNLQIFDTVYLQVENKTPLQVMRQNFLNVTLGSALATYLPTKHETPVFVLSPSGGEQDPAVRQGRSAMPAGPAEDL